MAIWTSRYSNKGLAIQSNDHYPVGISIGRPRFRLGYMLRDQCYSLAPKGYMLNMDIEDFRKAYYGKLGEIGEGRIINMVNRLDERARREGKELVLLCFEDVRVESEWCHRTIFAQWWAEKTGEVIRELPDPIPPKGKAKKDNRKTADFLGKTEKNMSR